MKNHSNSRDINVNGQLIDTCGNKQAITTRELRQLEIAKTTRELRENVREKLRELRENVRENLESKLESQEAFELLCGK